MGIHIEKPPAPVEILVFEIGSVRFALPAPMVAEVARAVAIVPLPRAPAVVEGLIAVRGALVPVLDLRQRFRLGSKPVETSDHLVLARAGRRLVAIRADRAESLRAVSPDAVESLADPLPRAGYVAGVAKLPDGLVLIHDLGTFLDEAESEALDAAIAEARP